MDRNTLKGSRDPLGRAMAAHQAGRLDEADALYRRAIQDDPADAQALRLRGILARELGDLEAAGRYLTRAAELAPADPEPLAELAVTRMAEGRLDAAEDALRDALVRQPDDRKALANLGALLQYRGHITEAIGFHRRALETEAGDLEVRCNLAKALAESGHGEEALAACDEALAMAPAHPLVLAAQGAVLCDLEKFELATDALERATIRYPDDDTALVNLAFARARLGQHAAAVEALRGALRANPHSGRATADLASLLSADGKATAALAMCAEFLGEHPGERQVLAVQAYALGDAGRNEEARSLLDFERLIHVMDLLPPPGFARLEDFNQALAVVIAEDPSLMPSPASKATRGGGQTGEFRRGHDPVLRAFGDMIDATVTNTARELCAAGFADHPAMAPVKTGAAPAWTLRMWGTVLGSGGYQTPHIHPMGWLSGVYYVSLPEDMGSSGLHCGWIEFGAPPARLRVASPPQARAVEPRPGRLVLFPSYFHHRTLPFVSAQRRVSIAFDVVPRH